MTRLVNDYMVFHVEIGDDKGIQEWVLGDTDPSAAVKSWFATSAKDDDMDQINIDKERKRVPILQCLVFQRNDNKNIIPILSCTNNYDS